MNASAHQTQQKPSDGKKDDIVKPEKVHSANSWETADLGDGDRKQKFLKLMGAAKSEHRGRFVIGDREPAKIHARDKQQTEEINKELEEQYKHTFEHRVTKRSHKGLGFDDNDKTEGCTIKPFEESTEKVTTLKLKEENIGKKSESSEDKNNSECIPKKPKMMMNFVKANDSN